MVLESRQKDFLQPDEGAHVLSLRDIVQIIWRRLWLIVLVIIVFTGITLGFTITQTPMYESSVVLLVSQRQAVDPSFSNLAANIDGLQKLTKTLTEGVGKRPTAEAVIKQLNLGITPGDLLNNLKVQQIPDTQFIRVTYKDSDPERAQQVANATGQVASDQIYDVSSNASGVTATVWEPAETPDTPVSPNLTFNVLLALVASTVLGLGLVFLLEYFDNSWRTPEKAERILEAPNLGVVQKRPQSTSTHKNSSA